MWLLDKSYLDSLRSQNKQIELNPSKYGLYLLKLSKVKNNVELICIIIRIYLQYKNINTLTEVDYNSLKGMF